ncbi:MAG TPA: NRDE family protein [Candidatus Competibacteraceae bacterium]|nr:NRDE family protein [Candidatus Competibacteraceae bacterium]HSA45559.1 NRDE family protein [Candidatus Competibacteraceae bacterium]
MCLVLMAYRCHPGYELLVAANRDEFHDRPTAPLAFWEDAPDLLAGRDLQEGGTWMGITRTGRFAAITNYRDPCRVKSDAPSRGHLVSGYLQGEQSAGDALERLRATADRYNSFNLLLGDETGLYYYSNRADEPRALPPGFYGLSNHLLDTPWPKLKRGLAMLHRLLERRRDPAPDDLLQILTDRTLAPDAELPQTGVPLEWERWLSAIFIDAPGYGTRSSTALLVDSGGNACMAETTWSDASRREFQLNWPARST